MTEIRFYHLTQTALDRALPQILAKAHASGARVALRTTDDAQAEHLADLLWTYNPNGFLPHGTKVDGNAELQPVWLSPLDGVPNGAKIAVTVCGAWPAEPAQFDLCCDVFDGRNEETLNAARARWKALKDAGHTLTYWQQTETGWEKKA